MGKTEIRPLTGLRGIAARWVVLFPMYQADGPNDANRRLLKNDYLAVDIVFVLSGFVLALSYQSLFRNDYGKRPYAMFLVRRFARV